MKIMLVSDAANFAISDVYNGYLHALEQLKIPFESHPYHLFRSICSDSTCYHRIHSIVLNKHKQFTHLMFIGGLNIPDYLFDSLYHIKSIVVATEDPHSFDIMKKRLDKINYYFTNERSIAKSNKYKNVYYNPTAADTFECGKIPIDYIEDRYKSDILFLGAIYPNRQKILESIVPFVEKNKLIFKICGHTQYISKKSPLSKYIFDERTIPHQEVIKYYNGAKVVINIHRDITWHPLTTTKKNPFNKSKFPAESLNPRSYEVPLCQTLMLIDDIRAEAREIFNEDEVLFFSDSESLINQLEYTLFKMSTKEKNNRIFKAYKKVSTYHTYLNRMKYIKNIIENVL